MDKQQLRLAVFIRINPPRNRPHAHPQIPIMLRHRQDQRIGWRFFFLFVIGHKIAAPQTAPLSGNQRAKEKWWEEQDSNR
jgi:hypothetical protein